MAAARPLRDVFTELTGDEDARHSDPAELLRANGHPDLPGSLVAEAVVTFADTAPIEVAQHLAAYVGAHSPVPLADGSTHSGGDIDASTWLATLTTAPAVVTDADPTDGLDQPPAASGEPGAALLAPPADGGDLDFGHGPPSSDRGDPGDSDLGGSDRGVDSDRGGSGLDPTGTGYEGPGPRDDSALPDGGTGGGGDSDGDGTGDDTFGLDLLDAPHAAGEDGPDGAGDDPTS